MQIISLLKGGNRVEYKNLESNSELDNLLAQAIEASNKLSSNQWMEICTVTEAKEQLDDLKKALRFKPCKILNRLYEVISNEISITNSELIRILKEALDDSDKVYKSFEKVGGLLYRQI